MKSLKRLGLLAVLIGVFILFPKYAWAGFWIVHLPISGVEIPWLLLVFIGFAVGVIGGFYGMGGGWLVTPCLNLFGFPMPFAIGTDLAHIAGKSMISTVRHWKFANVDVKLGFVMLVFTMIGIEIGAKCTMGLERMGIVGPAIRWIYIAFLIMIIALVGYDIIKKRRQERAGIAVKTESATQIYKYIHAIKIPPVMHFKTANITCSIWMIGLVGFITGWLAGILGIGGGLFRMPALIYFIGCPTYVAVGTDLFEVMFSGLYGAFTYTMKGRMEIVAVVIMLCGASIGAQIGTVATKYVKGYFIRVLFGAAVSIACISLLLKQFGAGIIAGWLIICAVGVLCGIILYQMIRGASQELRAKKASG